MPDVEEITQMLAGSYITYVDITTHATDIDCAGHDLPSPFDDLATLIMRRCGEDHDFVTNG